MARRTLTLQESEALREALQVAVLDALVRSRRWEPGDLAFQGGTCLHLVHGSPRFSEDLDFLITSPLKQRGLREAVLARLGRPAWVPADLEVGLARTRNESNPHAFTVTLTGPTVVGSVKVKVELWQCSHAAASALQLRVEPVRAPATGLAAHAAAQTFVPSLTEREILADKVFAMGARAYLKPRDVFDLHWLLTRDPQLKVTPADMGARLLIYPNSDACKWIDAATERAQHLAEQADAIQADLARWLPGSMRPTPAATHEMVATSANAMRLGIQAMQAHLQRDHEFSGSRHERQRG